MPATVTTAAFDVPWPLAVVVAGAMATTIGVLWKRLVDKDDEWNRRYLDLLDRYHRVVVAIQVSLDNHQAAKLAPPRQDKPDTDPPLGGGQTR